MDADRDNTAFDMAPAHETGRGPQQDLGSNVAAETTQSDGMYTFQDHGKTDELGTSDFNSCCMCGLYLG